MTTIQFGNDQAIEGYYPDGEDGPVHYRAVEGERVTTFSIPDSWDLAEGVREITNALGFHFDLAGGAAPRWVEGDDEAIVAHFRHVYGVEGKPGLWGEPKHPGPAKKAAARKRAAKATKEGDE